GKPSAGERRASGGESRKETWRNRPFLAAEKPGKPLASKRPEWNNLPIPVRARLGPFIFESPSPEASGKLDLVNDRASPGRRGRSLQAGWRAGAATRIQFRGARRGDRASGHDRAGKRPATERTERRAGPAECQRRHPGH